MECCTKKRGEHWCTIYNGEEEHRNMSTKFLLDGLKRNEKVTYVLDVHNEQQIVDYFKTINIDLSPYIESGAFQFLPKSVYLQNGNFDVQTTIRQLEEITIRAVEKEGYPRLRIIGEIGWANTAILQRKILDYEVKLVDFCENYPCIGLCQYPRELYDPDMLIDVLTVHPKVIVEGEEMENFYYIPPDNYQVDSKTRLKHMTQNLRDRYHTKRDLEQKTELLLETNEAYGKEITKRQKIQHEKAEVEDLYQAKTEFTATVSHEIRTPLNGIIATAQLLGETSLVRDQKELVQTIQDCGSHLVTVLNDVLDFAKIKSGKFDLERKPVAIKKCIESVMGLFRDSHKVQLSSIIDENVFDCIIGDITRIRQVLMNLVSNAIKFTKEGGSVKAYLSSNKSSDLYQSDAPQIGIFNHSLSDIVIHHFGEECELLFKVQDTGIGIPEEYKSKIFTAFSQVDSSTTRQYGGTGLGLAICKNLVEAMGGKIWFESVLGKGTTFYFTIRTRGSNEPVETAVTQKNLEPQQHSLKFLIAEDNKVNQMILKRILQKLGHVTTTVENGREAVQMVSENDFDAVFMDLQMPLMGGIEASTTISQMDWSYRRKPAIIATTASTAPADRVACLHAGMEHFLGKPVQVNDVKSITERISL